MKSLQKLILLLGVLAVGCQADAISDEVVEESGRYIIEGKVYPPELSGDSNWQSSTRISINDGEYKGFLKEDGTFIVNGVPSGSYVLEIVNPDYFYEPIRVEINPKGKFRARKVNYIQPGQIIQVPYPLKVKALTRFKYFQTREQWKVTDFLFSPMVLMMALPLILLLVLPMFMNDPEMKKDMENMKLMKNNMPEFGEMLTNMFAKGSQKSVQDKPSGPKPSKKRN